MASKDEKKQGHLGLHIKITYCLLFVTAVILSVISWTFYKEISNLRQDIHKLKRQCFDIHKHQIFSKFNFMNDTYKDRFTDRFKQHNAFKTRFKRSTLYDRNWVYLTPDTKAPISLIKDFCTQLTANCTTYFNNGKLQGPPGPPGKVEYGTINGTFVLKGEKGDSGYNGTAGFNGIPGQKGKRGRRGKTGYPGEKGDRGEKGDKGNDGGEGKWIKFGPDNCTCMRGPPGIPGKSVEGPRGPTGAKGERGAKGDRGENMAVVTTQLPTIAPRQKECFIEMIGTPLFRRFTKTYWGSWMRDSERHLLQHTGKIGKYWSTKHFTGNVLYEYHTEKSFKIDIPDVTYDLGDYHYIGTGHVVYRNSFFYHNAGFNRIVKFDFIEKKVVKIRTIENSRYSSGQNLYSIDYNYFDFSVDENGLWVIYGGKDKDTTLLVSRVDPNTLNLLKTWELFVNHASYGNGFIVCGVLYLIKNPYQQRTVIDFAYDLYKTKELPVTIGFINPFSMTHMVSYNPRENSIYGWDRGNQITYPIRFI